MRMKAIVSTLVVAMLISGCARTPDLKIGYKLAGADLSLKVARTIICDEANNPVIISSVVSTLTHSSDRAQGQQWLTLKPLSGAFTNADVKLERFEDGRIKGVNATTTGQGEAIVKAIASAIPLLPFDGPATAFPTECAFIKSAGGGKPLTLTFEGPINLAASPGTWQDIPAEFGSSFYFAKLLAPLGTVCATITETSSGTAPVELGQEKPNDVKLRLREPGRVSVRVSGAKTGGPCGSAKIWDGSFAAGQFGTPYDLPIPRAALFGKQSFAATVSESGALLSVQYGHETGAAQAIGAFGAMSGALYDTPTEKAAEIKSEADLIVQQQRLALCTAKPAECK
jgi:hypothetical protein